MCWAWVPPLEDDVCHDEHLHASVLHGAQYVHATALHGAQYVLRHVQRYVLRHVLRRVLGVLVLHVSPKGKRGGGTRVLGVGSAAGR